MQTLLVIIQCAPAVNCQCITSFYLIDFICFVKIYYVWISATLVTAKYQRTQKDYGNLRSCFGRKQSSLSIARGQRLGSADIYTKRTGQARRNIAEKF